MIRNILIAVAALAVIAVASITAEQPMGSTIPGNAQARLAIAEGRIASLETALAGLTSRTQTWNTASVNGAAYAAAAALGRDGAVTITADGTNNTLTLVDGVVTNFAAAPVE